jgi:BlaI family transcriptional regulator, penicillinase repressor
VPHSNSLSRRERQIMEIIYKNSSASVEEIQIAMPQPASYSAVRVIVNVLERKGHLKHARQGKKFVYSPTTPRTRAIKEALKHLLSTYFGDSLPKAIAAMVQLRAKDIGDEDLRQLILAIEQAKKEDSS